MDWIWNVGWFCDFEGIWDVLLYLYIFIYYNIDVGLIILDFKGPWLFQKGSDVVSSTVWSGGKVHPCPLELDKSSFVRQRSFHGSCCLLFIAIGFFPQYRIKIKMWRNISKACYLCCAIIEAFSRYSSSQIWDGWLTDFSELLWCDVIFGKEEKVGISSFWRMSQDEGMTGIPGPLEMVGVWLDPAIFCLYIIKGNNFKQGIFGRMLGPDQALQSAILKSWPWQGRPSCHLDRIGF